MVFFKNETLEIWIYTESHTEYNSYYEPKKEYFLDQTIPCDFQVMNTTEQLKEFGEIHNDTYKIYLPPNTNIPDGAILRLTGKPDTYEIIGTIIQNNHLPIVNHTKTIIRKQRKPTQLGENP